MEIYECEICKTECSIELFSRTYKKNKHYLICNTCLNNIKVCSKSKCKNNFLLNDSHITNLKYIYLSNKNNTNKYYLYSEIQKIIIGKYGNMNNLKKILAKKNKQKLDKKENKEIQINKRKEKLIYTLKMNKLEYKNYGDCYSFIMTGSPSIDNVIKNELDKIDKRSERKKELIEKLNKLDIPLDESLPACYQYINNIGYKTLEQSVQNIEIQYFFKHETDYDNLLKEYSVQQAKDIALQKYIQNKNGKSKNMPKNITTKIILKFD
jgi:hypothetical protein